MKLLFNQVILKEADKSTALSLMEFLNISLAERVRLILRRKILFLLNGTPVDLNIALDSLRKRNLRTA